MKTHTKEMEFQRRLQDVIEEAVKQGVEGSSILGMLYYELHAITRQIQDRGEREVTFNTEMENFFKELDR